MCYKNASFPKKPYSNVNSSRSSLISVIASTLANRFSLKLGITTSLLATICLPNSTQAYATDLEISNKNTAFKSSFASNTHSYVRSIPFLPSIFSVASLKSQSVNLSRVVLEEDAIVLNRANKTNKNPFNTAVVADGSKSNINRNVYVTSKTLPFLHTSVVAKAPFWIYTVKPGDTVHQIAKRYQVSSSELVKVNKINNSNVIFVNQRLKIPAKVTKDALSSINTHKETKLVSTNSSNTKPQSSSSASNLTNKVTKENYANLPKPNSNKVNSVTSTDDTYITKVTEQQIRIRDRNRSRQKQTKNTSISTGLPSANHLEHNRDRPTRENNRDTPKQIDVATSAIVQDNLQSDLLSQEIISLQLPPLPPEEYLPSAFDGYIWPAQGVLTSGYGWRWGRLHRGIDIAAPVGTPILAAASGTVISAGWHSGYGNLIKLEHLDGSITLYAHNNRNLVKHGQKVDRGEQIAEMGSTGHSTGSHLHFEIHLKDRGFVNPLALLGSR